MEPARKQKNRISSIFSTSSDPDTSSVASSESSGRLSKLRNRISSAQLLAPDYPPPPAHNFGSRSQEKLTITPVDSTPSLQAPRQSSPASRTASPARSYTRSPLSSRPGTPNAEVGLSRLAPEGLKKLRRKSRTLNSSQENVHQSGQNPQAWVVGHRGKVAYPLHGLLDGDKVTELWDEEGDTFVYLFPRTSGKGPSFRIDSSAYASSQYMTRLVHGRLYSESTVVPQRGRTADLPDRMARTPSGSFGIASRTTSPDQTIPEGSSDGSKGSRALSDATEDDHTELHMYLPIALSTDHSPVTPTAAEPKLNTTDVDTLIAYRNFFAFLVGQSLIATERNPQIFQIFLRIADILDHFQFSNVDGSSYGEVAASSFDSYVDELNLADVRSSREKTIEAIILGERMRSMSLYTEGFVHCVGKFNDVKQLGHPKLSLVSHKTMQRMSRANMDLELRQKNIDLKLRDFEFKAIFSGIMNSDTADEGKIVKFKAWRSSFLGFRSHILDYYKSKYGSWPPKASSKKNSLTTSGLNRLVLMDLYKDMSALYDLLADRTNITTRTADGFMSEEDGDDYASVTIRALRRVMSEYDRSVPPVQPPVPFDLPLYPELSAIKNVSTGDAKKMAKARTKKLGKEEIVRVLNLSHNADAESKTPFLDSFRQYERKAASGRTLDEIWDLRTGQWLFMYAVIQSLPMLVVDARGVRFTEAVEYFLCEAPKQGAPWQREESTQTRTWFGVAGGSQVVNLPAHIVEYGVDGIYRRSHCWEMAEKWSQNDSVLNAMVHESLETSLPPPPNLLTADSAARSRSQSPDHRRESVMNLGLEALPLPGGISPSNPIPRPQSSHDPTKTFDAILGSVDQGKDKKKKKR